MRRNKNEETAASHVPVLLAETLEGLRVWSEGIYLDGTYGRGGHARAVLARLGPKGRLLVMDRDPDAIADAQKELGQDPRVAIRHATFAGLSDWEETKSGLDGVLFDLGVSSPQLDEPARGFSFQADGPLDMRMSRSGLTAAEFLNTADEAEIARVLRDYGEEPRARAIARAIVAGRPVERTAELAAIVRRAAGFRRGQKSDPATRTFQAIRIHLNAELDELEQGLEAAERALKPGGRLAVVTFHSLEDRIVKRFLRERSGGTPAGSRHRPALVDPNEPTFERVAKPVAPSERELAANPRARSARLRSAVRTSAPPRKHNLGDRLQ